MADEPEEVPWRVLSMYGARTRQPAVQIVIGDQMFALPTEKAREIAGWIIEAAFAAEADAALFEFGAAMIGGGDDKAGAQLVAMLREWRKAREGGT
jgi:hypothetical protein